MKGRVMLVMSEGRVVGRVPSDGRIYRDGDFVRIEKIEIEIEDAVSFGAMNRHLKKSVIAAPVRRVTRSVKIDELSLMNRYGGKYCKSDTIAHACLDRKFTELMENGADIRVASDVESMSLIVTASLTVIDATLDLAEQLFDLDEFTPA